MDYINPSEYQILSERTNCQNSAIGYSMKGCDLVRFTQRMVNSNSANRLPGGEKILEPLDN